MDGKDLAGIANAVKSILEDPIRAGKMGGAGREKAIGSAWPGKSRILKAMLNDVCLK